MSNDNGKDLVPARMINEVLYCERLMYLEHEHREFAHNYYTADGTVIHKRADKPGGKLPPKPNETENDERPYKARAVWLSSDSLGITAKIDIVEGSSDGSVVPIEYKRGDPPDVPEGAYLPERAQVCAQAMLLREHNYRVDHAEIYFAAAKQRVRIAIDDKLVETVKRAAARVREISTIPPPLIDSPKCRGCSLVGICLPDEVNLLNRSASNVHRQLSPARDDCSPLYVQDHGAKVGLSGECLVVRKLDGEKTEIGLPLTSHVCLFGGAQISPQAIRECMSRGIQISFFTTGGWYCGRTVSADSKNVELRTAQYKAASDREFCLRIARGIVNAKIENCRTMLRRNSDVDNEVLRDLANSAANALTRLCLTNQIQDGILRRPLE
jgi:CRISPR-associated protein Cas4